MKKKRPALIITGLLCALWASQAQATVVFSEDFGGNSTTGWVLYNRSSPSGNWPDGWTMGAQISDLRSRQNDQKFAASNYETAGDAGPGNHAVASTWLISPILAFHNGDVLAFDTCALQDDIPDRLQVRLNRSNTGTNVGGTATSVGDFSTLLLDINSNYATHGDPAAYPTSWIRYQITLSGLAGATDGRFAFRYFLTDGGDSGTQGDEIGVDSVQLSSSVPEPGSISIALIGSLLSLRQRRRRLTN